MAIREDIILDPSKGIKGLDEMNRATMKYARKQERLYKQNQKSIQAIEDELQKLRRVREASNNPQAVQKYTNTIEKLEKEQKQLRKETERYGDTVKKTSKESQSSFQKIGKAAKNWIVGVAIGALLAMGEALRRVSGEQIRFEQKMNESLAIMGDVSLGMRNQMEETARTVSEDLNIAVDKAAESYFFLASAGLDAQQSIAALPAVAEFAKAGMFDMATATDLATDAQSALGLTVEDSVENQKNLIRVTDVLTKANTLANGSIQQFSEALTNRAAAALRSVNKDIEEGVAVLAAFADQGVKGQRAGDELARILRITARAASQNTEQFKEMGLITEEGNLASLVDIIEGLTNELEGLSDTQQASRLEQLGFTAEVQASIKPLLGQADAIREYNSSLDDAAGTTQEVADKQLKALQERAGQVAKSFKNNLGPAVGGVMDFILTQVEKAAAGLQTLIDETSTANEELLNILQRTDADPEIIAEVQTRVDLANAEELKKELEEQVSGFTVPTAVVEGSDITEPFDVDVIGDSAKNVGIEYAKSLLEGFRGELQNLPSQIDEAVDRGATGRASYLRNRARAIEDAITQLQTYITLQKNLKATEEAIKSLRSEDPASPEKEGPVPSDETVEKTKDWIATLRKIGDTQEQLAALSSINLQSAGGAELGKTLSIISDIDKQFNELAQGDIVGAISDAAVDKIRAFNQELTKLNNEYSAGVIDQKEYERQLKKLSDTFLDQLQEMYRSIKDKLTPAQQELWKEMFGNFEDAAEGGEEFKGNLDDIADTADAILNVADAFGAIGDNARKSLRGISDVLRSVQKIKELGAGAGALSYALPAIGVAGGLLSMLSGAGLFGDSGRKEELTELTSSLKSLRRSVDRNTEAFYEQSVIAAGSTEEDIRRGQELASDRLPSFEGNDFLELISKFTPRIPAIRNRLGELGELFPDMFGESLDIFNNLIEQQDFEGAIDFVRSLEGRMGSLAESFGQYGQSVDAAIRIFNDQIKFAGATASEAMDSVVDKVRELDTKIPSDILQELEGLDLSTEEGKNRLQEIVQELFENRNIMRGDLSPDEFSNVLDFLESQAEGGGASGSTGDGYSRSVQIARTITDVQANEMIMFLERIEAWTRATAASLGDQTAMSISVPDVAYQPISGGNIASISQNMSKSNSVSIGEINMSSGITDEDIDNLMLQISRKLKQELRGSQF